MINVIAVDSIRTLPFSAELGFSLVFFYLMAAVFFFIPSGLVSAELATGWPSTGGVYVWIREAFGKKVALIIIWFNWIYNVFWYPTILALLAGVFTYFFNPNLSTNKIYMSASTCLLFWGATLLNLKGMKLSSIVSTVGALIGTIAPMLLIIGMGMFWLFKGEPLQIEMSWEAFFPDFNRGGNLAFFSPVLFGLLGLEMAATHAAEMKNPKKDYPRAIFISMGIILLTIIFSALTLALIVPGKNLSLVTGVLQAFFITAHVLHIPWLVPLLAGTIILGGLSGVSAWIIGPTKGLMVAAEDGSLPHFLTKKNQASVPKNILILQGIIVSILSLAFVLMPSVNSSFWLLSQVTAQHALIVYFALFAAGIALRYEKGAKKQRSFSIPGGKKGGMWCVGSMGIFACLVAFCLGFIPPVAVGIGKIWVYEMVLILGIFVSVTLPFIFKSNQTK